MLFPKTKQKYVSYVSYILQNLISRKEPKKKLKNLLPMYSDVV